MCNAAGGRESCDDVSHAGRGPLHRPGTQSSPWQQPAPSGMSTSAAARTRAGLAGVWRMGHLHLRSDARFSATHSMARRGGGNALPDSARTRLNTRRGPLEAAGTACARGDRFAAESARNAFAISPASRRSAQPWRTGGGGARLGPAACLPSIWVLAGGSKPTLSAILNQQAESTRKTCAARAMSDARDIFA